MGTNCMNGVGVPACALIWTRLVDKECWFGFVLATMLVNNSFAKRDWRLLWIDGGHWLIVLLLMGAIVGTVGTR